MAVVREREIPERDTGAAQGNSDFLKNILGVQYFNQKFMFLLAKLDHTLSNNCPGSEQFFDKVWSNLARKKKLILIKILYRRCIKHLA